MFPHSDTVYAVHTLRLQDELKYAARQRLAATAREATGRQAPHFEMSDVLARIARRFGAGMRGSFAAPRSQPRTPETGRAGAIACPRITAMRPASRVSTPLP